CTIGAAEQVQNGGESCGVGAKPDLSQTHESHVVRYCAHRGAVCSARIDDNENMVQVLSCCTAQPRAVATRCANPAQGVARALCAAFRLGSGHVVGRASISRTRRALVAHDLAVGADYLGHLPPTDGPWRIDELGETSLAKRLCVDPIWRDQGR